MSTVSETIGKNGLPGTAILAWDRLKSAACSKAMESAPRASAAIGFFLKRAANSLAIPAAALSFMAAQPESKGVTIPDGASPEPYKVRAQAFASVLFGLTVTAPIGTRYASATFLGFFDINDGLGKYKQKS